jgi:hypothetical protein
MARWCRGEKLQAFGRMHGSLPGGALNLYTSRTIAQPNCRTACVIYGKRHHFMIHDDKR